MSHLGHQNEIVSGSTFSSLCPTWDIKVLHESKAVDSVRSMSAKGEEFLTMMLWTYDLFARPSLSRAGESYERWAYRNGFVQPVQRLENRGLVERKSSVSDARVCRLTERARLRVIGGRDPASQWSRVWDGTWRVALFDVPVGDEGRRKKLRRYLRSYGAACRTAFGFPLIHCAIPPPWLIATAT